ncbi:hypothetical protein [Nocardia abscessus]|uniref:hypothetical protein n=1 Tax=Nocardia abscessus TaxID=120957 RepID=UPI002453BC99|nr:hypothetical protein [Nocardia abscessus]
MAEGLEIGAERGEERLDVTIGQLYGLGPVTICQGHGGDRCVEPTLAAHLIATVGVVDRPDEHHGVLGAVFAVQLRDQFRGSRQRNPFLGIQSDCWGRVIVHVGWENPFRVGRGLSVATEEEAAGP